MIAIPAIDIMNGKCVRLFKGRFAEKTFYDATPLGLARDIESAGLTHLHLIDLDGAHKGEPANLPVLEQLAKETTLIIDYGGGIRSMETIRKVLDAGAAKANLGTFLFSSPDIPLQCIESFGADALIAAVDIKDGQVAVKGWQQNSGIKTGDAIEGLLDIGWKFFSVTDISRDGTMEGPDPEFYIPLADAYPSARFIGGGGVATVEHLYMLRSCGLYAAVTGKAIFEGHITLDELAILNART